MYPAKFPGVLAVSGTLINDNFASTTDPANTCVSGGVTYGSRYGPEVAISAPFLVEGAMSGNGTFDASCGTSFAAPLVSAVAAMVWSQNPTWTAAAVKSRLEATANDLGAVGRDQYFGYGRVNAYAATYFPPPPPFSVTNKGLDQVKP